MATKKKRKTPPTVKRLQTAMDRRAKDMGWSEHDRAARRRMAAALRTCRAHYRKHLPHHWRFMVRSARIQILQAVRDCRTLDALLLERSLPPVMMEAFTEYNHSGALAGIDCRAYAELAVLTQGKRPSSKVSASGEPNKFTWKFTLERVREALRDGRSVEYALDLYADTIQSMALSGQAGFFEELGDLFRKHRSTPFKRSLTDWIVRAWLPLCLWECSADGHEAHSRFCQAADLLELNFPGAEDAVFYHQFITAWRNTRSKKMNPKARTFVKPNGQRD